MLQRIPEGIRDLREICQHGSHGPEGQPGAFQQIRRVSIYVTWVMLHLPISPNGLTLLGVGTGIVAAVLFADQSFVAAVIVLQLAIVLDFTDGEVSRYRKQQSKEGSYLDRVYHFTVNPAVFAGLSLGTYRQHASMVVLAAGFITTASIPAFSIVTAYANELALWKHARKLVARLNDDLQGDAGRLDTLGPLVQSVAATSVAPDQSIRASLPMAQRLGNLSRLWDFPYTLFVVTIASLAEAVLTTPGSSWKWSPLAVVLLFYALTYPCWMAVYVYHVLRTKTTERGFATFAGELALVLSRARNAHLDD